MWAGVCQLLLQVALVASWMEEDKLEARVFSKKGLRARSPGSLKRERSGG